MVRRICFFSVGFAFNRLVRLRYYEKIFPKNIEIFLITTDKHKDIHKWKLNRTKIITLQNNPLKNMFEIRKLCKKNDIEIVSNLGHPFGIIPLIFASLFNRKKVLLYFLGDILEIYKTTNLSSKKIKLFLIILPYVFLSAFSDKVAFVGYRSYKKSSIAMLLPKKKARYLLAPVNVNLFKPLKKSKSRKKLNIGKDKKIVLFVGRVTYLKGGDLLCKLILANPQIDFIVIGKWVDKEIPKIKASNLKVIDAVPNQNLPDYYSSADLVFAYNRQGDQPQIVGGESLACGVPVIHTKRIHAPDKEFIIKVADDLSDANKKINLFLKKKASKNLSKSAREYAVKYLSDESWENKYLEFYLH